jgi:c-di-GMP-related signal transduction protein
VDFLATPPESQLRFCREYACRNTRMLAEKVETYGDFERARDCGYALFQGYFFSRQKFSRGMTCRLIS